MWKGVWIVNILTYAIKCTPCISFQMSNISRYIPLSHIFTKRNMFAKDNLIHKYSLKRLERLYVEMFSYLFSSAELVISNIKIFRANNSLSLIKNNIMLGEEGGVAGW